MPDAERNIQMAINVTPDDAIKSFKRLQSQAQKTFDALSTKKSTKEIQKLEIALSKSVSNGEKLNNKLDEASKKQIPTEAYKDLSKDIEYAEKRLAQLTAQQERARKAESMKPVVAEYEQLQQKAEHYKTTIENLTKQQGEDSDQVKQLKVEYQSVLMNLDKMAPKVELLHQRSASYTAEVKQQNDMLVEMRKELEEMVQAGKTFTVDSSGIEEAKNALVDNNNQIRLNQEAIAVAQQKQSEAAKEHEAQIHAETQAMEQLAVQFLQTKLNAGEQNAEIQQTVKDLQNIDTVLEHLRARQQELERFGAGLGYAEYDKNLAEIRELEEEQGRLNQKLDEYREKQSQQNQGLSESAMRMQDIQNTAGPINEEFFKMSNALKNVNQELEQLYVRQQDLEQAGRGLGFEEYDANLAKIRELETEQERLNEEIAEYRERMASVEEPMSRWESFKETLSGIWQGLKVNDGSFGKLASTLGKIASQFIMSASGANKLKSALQGVTQKATQSSFNFKKLFNTLLKYGIGVRSIFVLYRKIRSAITENIKYYALMNNGMNQTNKAISAMQSSLNALKGALAGAFIPIITHVSPMLTSFIDKIAAVVTAIGMFIAKLIGAKTYLKAVKKDTNYAAGLSSGGGGKSAQEKYEEAVKKAQEKYDKKVAETEAKNAERMAKAEEKQAKAADKLAKKQEQANDKLASFDDLNVLGTESLEELEEQEADLLDMPELELPSLEDFMDSGGGGASDPFGFEEVPLDDWEWNWDDLLKKARELGEKLAEFLNDVFKDEDLAKRIGNTIGNLINLAINFAYGFVSKFDFHQFGRWLGALLQEAIETIDWALLGQTIAKGLNGLADSIIGFFETYNVGTLGSSISTMLNNAIHEIDADKIGQATLDVLQAPLLELRAILTETHWRELGAKVSWWFHKVFSSEGLKGESLGTTIGRTLGAAVNAAIDFLLGLDIAQAITDIGMFFTDIFVGAANEIDWPSFFELIEQALLGFVEGLGNIASIWGGMICVSLEEAINDKLHIEIFKQEDIDRQKKEIELLREGLITTGDIAEGTADQIAGMYQKIGEGTQYSFDQLVRFQSGAGLADEQIQKMIESMQEYARTNGETFDAAALGLEGYTGNWQTFRDTVLGIVDETNEKITTTDGVVKGLSDTTDLLKEKTRSVGNTIKTEADTTAEKLDHTAAIGKDHLGILDAAIDTSDTNVNEYSDSAVEALSKVDAKTGEVSINFEQMTELVQLQLDSLTTMIDTWYQEMILQYFSYDAWLLMLQEGPLLALTDFFATLFLIEWDTQMQTWWTEHVLIWFANEKWQAEIYTPFYTFLQTKWKNLITWWDKVIKEWFKDLSEVRWKKLMKWWDESMNTWWNEQVVPWFEEERWREQFLRVYNVAEEVGKKTRDKIKELAEETEDAVHEACDAMIGWIEEVIAKLKEAIALAQQLAAMEGGGGGGGSSSSGGGSRGGGNGGGGSSGSRPFMPMLDIMHFEDNLGMSAFKFPELATGAVIPPNNEFLAVLGDQRSGTNIETPLSTMLEAFRSVMDEYMGGSHQSATMEVDGETFARLMMPHIMDEMHRLGYNTEIIEGI